jgi:hypothetical protein
LPEAYSQAKRGNCVCVYVCVHVCARVCVSLFFFLKQVLTV